MLAAKGRGCWVWQVDTTVKVTRTTSRLISHIRSRRRRPRSQPGRAGQLLLLHPQQQPLTQTLKQTQVTATPQQKTVMSL